ncbi:hypothetical protein BN2497_11943 [Janthinobacterium sp. CG23_2]|nr:hypothetical protein BN2497_11943 [Janthinobacterium sp. CG23_2]CUU32369.1 hypothetical protein BN3177_11943 [Janthinobacterium sp. CG23_2]
MCTSECSRSRRRQGQWLRTRCNDRGQSATAGPPARFSAPPAHQ